jgi:hypothetical protein
MSVHERGKVVSSLYSVAVFKFIQGKNGLNTHIVQDCSKSAHMSGLSCWIVLSVSTTEICFLYDLCCHPSVS